MTTIVSRGVKIVADRNGKSSKLLGEFEAKQSKDGQRQHSFTKTRPMDKVHWLIDDIKDHVDSLIKVDSKIEGTGNEGCDWHATYMTSALVIQLTKDPQRGTKRKFTLENENPDYPWYGP
ncbi:hypothetical protein ACROYT_G026349 [Oculina patagonica]